MQSALPATQDVLLRRRGLVFAAPHPGDETELPCTLRHVQAVEIDWAELGYVPSTRLRAALLKLPLSRLTELRERVLTVLARHLGAHVKHEPLFRKFPHGIPDDTFDLWLRKVLSHFLQDADQPCLFCRALGTTHVLSPCLHVVCERCFDGESYSACPVCERAVDRSSPFFKPSAPIPKSTQHVPLRLLDLGDGLEDEARKLVSSFCERKQAISPNDRSDFETILLDVGEPILSWLPDKIAVKENIALIFGGLFSVVDPAIVLPVAARYMKTATDVLRFIAVLSGTDGSLQPTARFVKIEREVPTGRWWGKMAQLLGIDVPKRRRQPAYITLQVRRFKMTKLGRPLRRTLLALLERLPPDALIEDMLRHRSYWVWAGEFLHPHEYAKRFPNVARAFQVVRKFAPDGTKAPAFHSFAGKLEIAAKAGDAAAFMSLLRERPGELGRRFDHALRVAGQQDETAQALVLDGFLRALPRLSNPVLLTLYGLLPKRVKPAAMRVYWPKGPVTTGVSRPDERPTIPAAIIDPAVAAITAELLRRFAAKPAWQSAIVDAALRRVMVPFNERTASRAAVALPRGSVVTVPRDKLVRMFLHWCQPKRGGMRTDIDLSVGFYTDAWKEAGVCSYYSLRMNNKHGENIATSAGDRTDAPFPDGASELIDLDWQRALAHGIRYAVMIVNNYSGMPFSLLERGFAGLMLRKSHEGLHFDPRTVELRFDLQGENGIYMPLVFDLQEGVMHWLDVYSQGELSFNNVATSNRAITRICPTLIEYFGSGVRPSMYELALLHAAARAPVVYLRDPALRRYVRGESESAIDFHTRITRDHGEPMPAFSPGDGATFAALYRGDLDLPTETTRYVLFPDRIATTISASDLIS